MVDEQQPQVFEFDLSPQGNRICITSGQELHDWNDKEFSKWQWLTNAQPTSDHMRTRHQNFRNRVHDQAEEWRRNPKNRDHIAHVLHHLGNIFKQFYGDRQILHSSAPQAVFLSDLGAKRGDTVTAGAYMAMMNGPISLSSPMPADFLNGIIEGFLYSREIDWTASAHEQVLNGLKSRYDANIADQNSRFEELKASNAALNSAFDTTLHKKAEALENLHTGQTEEFRKLIDSHVARLTAIEKTYDQKLALQKPVKYWQTKEDYHSKRAKQFSVAAIIISVLLATGMGFLSYWAFGKLGPDANPKHWQIGVLFVAAFFSIWTVRLLVRMFLSNLHLATDAAERRTMILTYLAMSREGAEFTKDDKRLIIQHLFRSASDGLVKDDAAPPTPMELLTRRS